MLYFLSFLQFFPMPHVPLFSLYVYVCTHTYTQPSQPLHCCLYVYDFRTDRLILDDHLGNSSLG